MNSRTIKARSTIPPALKRSLRQHNAWRLNSCLNLLPSENFSSPAVREMLSSDLANSEETRPGMREPQMSKIAELISRVWIEDEDPKQG